MDKICIYLLSYCMLSVLSIILVEYFVVDETIRWVAWDINLMLGAIACSVATYLQTNIHKILIKNLSLATAIIFSLRFLDYLIVNIFPYIESIQLISHIVTIIILVLLILFGLNKIAEKFTPTSDKYFPHATYILNRHPNTHLSFVGYLFSFFGKKSLIVKGQHFRFGRNKKIIEVKYYHKEGYHLTRISDAKLSEVRKEVLGKKLSLINNCFRIFSKYK